MKQSLKVILSLSLVVAFLTLCIVIISVGYTGLWLHTYNVFTEKTLVAKVEISELKSDNNGEYSDVTLIQYDYGSALDSIVGNKGSSVSTSFYKIYGDAVYIGGPILKFKDELILLNFKTVYKVSKIYGRYSDNEVERTKSQAALDQSSYDLNGGYGEWRSIFENLRSDGVIGRIYRTFIDTTQLSEPGQFVSNKPLKYDLYITNGGFQWNLIY